MDISDTLTDIGDVHNSLREFDLAFDCHSRALKLHEAAAEPNKEAIASNFVGMAIVYCARRHFSEALEAVKKALELRKSIIPMNEINVAATLIILGNIYHDSGEYQKALECNHEACSILESSGFTQSLVLAAAYNNLGAMHYKTNSLADARNNYERSINIYAKKLPPEHPNRRATEKNLRSIIQKEKIEPNLDSNCVLS